MNEFLALILGGVVVFLYYAKGGTALSADSSDGVSGATGGSSCGCGPSSAAQSSSSSSETATGAGNSIGGVVAAPVAPMPGVVSSDALSGRYIGTYHNTAPRTPYSNVQRPTFEVWGKP